MYFAHWIAAGCLIFGVASATASSTSDRFRRPLDMTVRDWNALSNEVDAVLEQDDALLHLTDGVDKEDVIGSAVLSPAGTWLVVGLRKDGPADSGSVHVYRKQPAGSTSPWSIAAVLRHPDAADGDEFGAAVTIDCASESIVSGEVSEEGCQLAASAPKDDVSDEDGIGSVHVFRFDAGAWKHDAMIVGPARAERDSFGDSLAIDVRDVAQPLLLMGDPETFSFGRFGDAYLWSSPAAGVWLPTGESETGSLAPNSSAEGYAGFSVAMDWPHVVIGAPNAKLSGGTSIRGGIATYLRLGESNVEIARNLLQCGDGPANAEEGCDFGFAVSVRKGFDANNHDGLIAASSPAATVAGSARAGAVYIYRLAGASPPAFEARYSPSPLSAQPGTRMGHSIALARDPGTPGRQILLVGSPGANSVYETNRICEHCGGINWIRLLEQGNVTSRLDVFTFGPGLPGLGTAVAVAHEPVAGEGIPVSLGTSAASSILLATQGGLQAGIDFGSRFEVQGLNERGSAADPLHALAGDADDRLGYSISVLGDFAAVGAPGFSRGADEVGAVYIFRRDAALIWRLEARILNPERLTAGAGARFGQSVALGRWPGATPAQDVEYLVIAAPGAFESRGAAYVFRRNGKRWDPMLAGHATVAGRIEPEAGYNDASRGFGSAVRTERGIAAVLWDRRTSSSSSRQVASIHEFDGNAWQATATLFAGPAVSQERIGAVPVEVDASDGHARVAVFHRSSGVGPNGVQVHEKISGTWERMSGAAEPYAQASVADAEASFGWSVALDGERLAVGAPKATVEGVSNAGAVFLYAFAPNGEWAPFSTTRLPVPDEGSTMAFGNALSLVGGNLFVGSGFDLEERGIAPSRVDWFAIDGESANPYSFIDTFEPRRLGNSDAGAFAASISVGENGILGIGMPGFEVGLAGGGASHPNQGAASFFEVDLGLSPPHDDEDGIFADGFELVLGD